MKPCNYCHCRPRRKADGYCSEACHDKKRTQNRRNQQKYRAKLKAQRAAAQRAAEATRTAIETEAVATLQQARAVLREPEMSYDYKVTVPALNLRTMKIETVKL